MSRPYINKIKIVFSITVRTVRKDGLKAAASGKSSAVISSPSLAGQKVIPYTGSSSGSGSLLASPSQNLRFSDIMKLAPPYSGGTAPVLHRTSLLGPYGRLQRLFSCINRVIGGPVLSVPLTANIVTFIIKNVKLFIYNYYKILILTCY